ncbi:MAG: insulinase family protein [Gemmatimonadales bacterium]|nr:insulinase family protein [Gemmatimonadota bacterium]MCL4214824.1 insulinase family protein [Gemmatimonadales bacterium]
MSAAPRPVPGVARPWEFPAVERARLANGVRVVVAPMPRLPIATVLALVDAGAVLDDAGREGAAVLTARTLLEGAAGLDGAALMDRFEALGTSLAATADWDTSSLRMTVTTSRLDEAFALFADVLRAPSFPARDVARRRDERIAALAQELAEPRGLADLRFDGFLYHRTARYARATDGTARSVPRLDAEVARAFHAAHYRPDTTTLIVVGDVTPGEARALVARRLGDWSVPGGAGASAGAAAAEPGDPARPARAARRTVVVNKPGAPQSELRVGHVGVPRTHPDHLPIVVMNAILGGLFSSRINLNLRERNAFTYGANSAFEWRRGAGPFVVSTAVKSEVTADALAEILREIDGMRAAPPSVSEVELATEYLAGVFPIRYETTAAVAGALAAAVLYALPDDWFLSYRARVRAITPTLVHAAAVAHLDPSRLLALAVGDAGTIAAPLDALRLGTLESHPGDHDPTEQA